MLQVGTLYLPLAPPLPSLPHSHVNQSAVQSSKWARKRNRRKIFWLPQMLIKSSAAVDLASKGPTSPVLPCAPRCTSARQSRKPKRINNALGSREVGEGGVAPHTFPARGGGRQAKAGHAHVKHIYHAYAAYAGPWRVPRCVCTALPSHPPTLPSTLSTNFGASPDQAENCKFPQLDAIANATATQAQTVVATPPLLL